MNLALFGSATTVDALTEQVAEAAELGFASFWTPQIFDLDALTALALVAQKVPDIRLGTAVVPTYPRHPMTLAIQALTVSQATGGRLDLGIGLSHQPVVEGMWGMSFDRPVKHLADYLDILLPLLHDGRVSHTGELVTGRGQLGIRADAPPVLVAALGPQMLRLTGRRADGTITWMTGPRTIGELTVPTITEAASSAGRPAPQVVAAVPVCITTAVDAARERAGKDYEIYGQLPSYRAMLDREGMAGPADIALIGDLDTVAAGLNGYVEAGATMVVASVFGSRDEQTTTRRELATLL